MTSNYSWISTQRVGKMWVKKNETKRGKKNISNKNMKKNTYSLGTREGCRSHYNHGKFSANYKSQALIHPLLWLLSSGQYGQSLSVMCRPMNLVPLWGEKQNQSIPVTSNQPGTLQPGDPMCPHFQKKKKATRLVKSGSWRHSIAAADFLRWTVQYDKMVVGWSQTPSSGYI